VLFLIVLAGWLNPCPAAEEPHVAFEAGPSELRIKVGGKPFATYVHDRGSIARPFFEHLHAPDGTLVTRNNPPVRGQDPTDHPTFHPGLWLAFGNLNGADFWRDKDRIRHAGFVGEPRGGPGRGAFAVRNCYETRGRVVAEEICRFTVLARPEGTLLLWDSEFHPEGDDLVFGDQEEMGLGVRVATPLAVTKGGRIRDSEGRDGEGQVWGRQSDWCAYGGDIGGKGVGVVLMPHPGNFRRSWFHARDYGLLVANPFGRHAFTKGETSRVVVKQGETLRLRFGVLVYGGGAGVPTDPAASYRDYLRVTEAN
jgi:hypothetical protein